MSLKVFVYNFGGIMEQDINGGMSNTDTKQL